MKLCLGIMVNCFRNANRWIRHTDDGSRRQLFYLSPLTRSHSEVADGSENTAGRAICDFVSEFAFEMTDYEFRSSTQCAKASGRAGPVTVATR